MSHTTRTPSVSAPASRGATPAHATTHHPEEAVRVLRAGQALSLRPSAPMALRIGSGRAWITLDDRVLSPRGEAAGDLFLHAGQTLWLAAGQHAVMEPLNTERLQYRLTGVSDAAARRPALWQRLALGPRADDACCA